MALYLHFFKSPHSRSDSFIFRVEGSDRVSLKLELQFLQSNDMNEGYQMDKDLEKCVIGKRVCMKSSIFIQST